MSTQAKKIAESFNLIFSKVISFVMASFGEMEKGLWLKPGSLPCGPAPLSFEAPTNLASFATELEPPPTASQKDFRCKGGWEEGGEDGECSSSSVLASIKGKASEHPTGGGKGK